MLSDKVEDLVKRCRRTERAVEACAEVAGDEWLEVCRLVSPEEADAIPDLADGLTLLFELTGVRLVRKACDEMVEADRESIAAAHLYQQLCYQRDATVDALYTAVSDFRDRCRRFLKQDEKLYLGVSGPTPRQPDTLGAWAGEIVSALDSTPLPVDPQKFDPGPHLKKIRTRNAAVTKALKAVTEGRIMKSELLRQRRHAVQRCEKNLLHCAQFVEAALRFVGLDDLALEIRGVRPVGRPRKDAPELSPETGGLQSPGESFSWLSNGLRRARRSISRLATGLRRARRSFE